MKISYVVWTPVWMFLGAIAGSIVGSVLGFFAGSEGAIPGAVVGLLMGGLGFWIVCSLDAEKEAAEKQKRDELSAQKHKAFMELKAQNREKLERQEHLRVHQAEQARLQATERRAQARRHAEARLQDNAQRAASKFSSLPDLIIGVESAHTSALQHFDAGAFSPFWSSIERAYENLGLFHEALLFIGNAAEAHPRLAEEFAVKFGRDLSVPAFPVDRSIIDPLNVGQRLAQVVGETVYEAQKVPTFAQIWEQRRTTAAVIAGFRNMDDAIAGMRRSLSSRLENLSGQLSPTENSKNPQMSEVVRLLTRQDLRAKGILSKYD